MKVLLATDGSNDAKAAVEWLRRLPLPPDREVLVLTVVTSLPLAVDVTMLGDLQSALLAEARQLADDTAAGLLTTRATGRVVEGDPRHEIVEAAKEWGADLIALGARGLGAIGEFLLGSVSLAVARHAPCPVLVCKGAPRDVRVVSVGMDGSSHAREAFAWLAALPLPPRIRVRLVGVAEPQRFPPTAPSVVREALRAAVAAVDAERRAVLETEMTTAGEVLAGRAIVETVVLKGPPADVLVRDAAERAADLVVVGARGLGTVSRIVLGSVSESVLRHARCPVLIVRRKPS